MLSLDSIRTYMIDQGLFLSDELFLGMADKSIDKSASLYSEDTIQNDLAIGGINNTSHEKRTFSAFFHWTTSYVQAEAKAIEIYEHFRANPNGYAIGLNNIVDVVCTSGNPIYLQTDDNNIHEFIMDFEVTYTR